jgi:hypothetical protein
VWIIPSRSRSHRLKILVEACKACDMATKAMVMIDHDDPMYGGYVDVKLPPSWTYCVILERDPLSKLYNYIFECFPDEGWYGFLADDVVPETKGFDHQLIEAAGRDGLAFGNDGINGERHATHFVLGGDLVHSVGFLSLPGLYRVFIDTVWNDIARERGVFRYLPHVTLTHEHFSNRKGLMDETYRKPRWAEDRATYEQWRKEHHGETA